jgi:hypothetical protein
VVVIESATKTPILETTMAGSILLAKLPPGSYTIKATVGGQTLTQTVAIEAQGLRQVDFRWNDARWDSARGNANGKPPYPPRSLLLRADPGDWMRNRGSRQNLEGWLRRKIALGAAHAEARASTSPVTTASTASTSAAQAALMTPELLLRADQVIE